MYHAHTIVCTGLGIRIRHRPKWMNISRRPLVTYTRAPEIRAYVLTNLRIPAQCLAGWGSRVALPATQLAFPNCCLPLTSSIPIAHRLQSIMLVTCPLRLYFYSEIDEVHCTCKGHSANPAGIHWIWHAPLLVGSASPQPDLVGEDEECETRWVQHFQNCMGRLLRSRVLLKMDNRHAQHIEYARPGWG